MVQAWGCESDEEVPSSGSLTAIVVVDLSITDGRDRAHIAIMSCPPQSAGKVFLIHGGQLGIQRKSLSAVHRGALRSSPTGRVHVQWEF